MKRGIFAMEEIQAEHTDVVATPALGVALYDAPNKTVFDALDGKSKDLVNSIEDKCDAVISLETITNHLEKSTKENLGKLGLAYANLAVEQICLKANFALEDMPLNPAAYDADSATVVTAGVKNLNETIGSLQTQEKADLVSLLGVLSDKRDYINTAIRKMYARLGEIDENLERVAQLGSDAKPDSSEIQDPSWYRNVCTNFEISGINVTCSSIKDLLTNHSHLYKRLIKKQLSWITDHKDNLLSEANGFSQYAFDPKEYVLPYAHTCSPDTNPATYSTDRLPGDAVFTTVVPPSFTYGYEAISALLSATGTLSYPYANESVRMRLVAPVLSIEDIKARSAEIKSLLEDIRHWSDVAYVQLWKDAIYDCDIVGYLLAEKVGTINQRGLTALASVVIDLLHKADGGIGAYALGTASSLLSYVEDSLSQYVTHKEVFNK